MNKYTKGAIATGAGIVLLLGGAGTFALWNDEQTVNAGDINSGVLDITSATGGQWSDTNGVVNIATYLAVPGDILTYTRTINITATGDNLDAELTVDGSSITGDTALLNALDVSISATGGTAATNDNGTPGVLTDDYVTLSSSASSQAIVVTVRVEFPGNSVTNLVAQNETVNLQALEFLVEQV